MAHGIIGVSGAKAWSICPPKERMEAQFPNTSGTAAKIGHALHYGLSGGLDGQPQPFADSDERTQFPTYLGTDNEAARALALLDDLEMFNRFTHDQLLALGENPSHWISTFITMRNHFRWAVETYQGYVHIEVPLPVGRAFDMPNQDDFWGSADLVITPLGDDDELLVLDYKSGRHIVNAERNFQMKLYALGTLYYSDALGFNPDQVARITMVISQPPAPNGGSLWTISKEDLLTWRDSFTPSVLRMLDPSSNPRASEFACKWCRAKSACTAYRGNQIDQLSAWLDQSF